MIEQEPFFHKNDVTLDRDSDRSIMEKWCCTETWMDAWLGLLPTSKSDRHQGFGQRMMKFSSFRFRKGLRLHDNPALKNALVGASSFRCIYILDPWFAGSSQAGVNKWRWVVHTGAHYRSGCRGWLMKCSFPLVLCD